jgi:hypothetical protein
MIWKTIDAQRGKGGEGSCTPSKEFKKFGHKNAVKHEHRGPPIFSYNPKKNLKSTVHLCRKLFRESVVKR